MSCPSRASRTCPSRTTPSRANWCKFRLCPPFLPEICGTGWNLSADDFSSSTLVSNIPTRVNQSVISLPRYRRTLGPARGPRCAEVDASTHCAIDIDDDDEQRLFPDGSDARLIERDRDRYYGQHSGISNGGSANVVDAGSIWRKNFLPENRISSNLRPPSPSVSSIAASSLSDWSSGITLAGTVALTLLCSLIFSSTSGPAPSHSTVYSPAGSCVCPAIVVD